MVFTGEGFIFTRPALRLVGPRDYSDHLESFTDQGAKRRSGELRRPPEEDAHSELAFAVVGPSLFKHHAADE
ncbi:MAG: hypothetical protein M3Q09_07685, partial [Gemmatimonadota bacterium]|nr:hypothetical protein [Gemmatimonadota bacterium]